MWIISEKKSINLDKILAICCDGCNLTFYTSSNSQTSLKCFTFENSKEMLKDINQAIYDGKKTFNFDAHLNYIEKRRKSND